MTAPARLTKHEIAAAISAAKEAGAARVVLEGGRIVVELRPVDAPAPAEEGDEREGDPWAGAA